VTGSGINIAKLLVEEYILDHPLEFTTPKEERLWLTVPKGVAKKYIYEEENVRKLHALLQKKKYVNPIFLKGDNGLNRMLRMWKNHFAQYKNFKTYYS
jgi:D-aspartate ligase